ncbi:MAG: carotenoid 1,2-hydratase [bacterium]|nr:carotenoid 1,2-hydratase [bacterium]
MRSKPRELSALVVAAGLACAPPTGKTPNREQMTPSAPGRLSVAASLGAGDTTEVEGFARALEPRTLLFPEDHGPHPEYRTEWWYWIGNLEAEDGRRFGYQLTFFRSALAPPAPDDESSESSATSDWATRQLYMAHLAVADVDGDSFMSFERFSRGALDLAGARSDPFRVWLEDWSVEASESGEAWIVRAAGGPVELRLTLDPGKPRVLHGDRGLSRKGTAPGAASYYYSRTRMPTRGSILLGDVALEVEGASWFDREWSTSLLAQDEVGWDWLGAQLEDGRELMFFRLRRRDGSSARADGTMVALDGNSRTLDTRGFALIPRGDWTSPETGVTYPAAFRLELPDEGLSLDIEPLLADQELRLSFVYWEGAVAISGTVAGQGYLEMTGYGDRASPR